MCLNNVQCGLPKDRNAGILEGQSSFWADFLQGIYSWTWWQIFKSICYVLREEWCLGWRRFQIKVARLNFVLIRKWKSDHKNPCNTHPIVLKIHTRNKHKVNSRWVIFIFNIFVVEILTKFYKIFYGKFLIRLPSNLRSLYPRQLI